jgi:uncharacterized 2Fe-2S/4Fe-4S cluster protein (DUF4445 family)
VGAGKAAGVPAPREFLAVFTPSGKRGRFAEGTSVLDAARRSGVDLDSVCGGRGICGRCRIEIGEGEFPKHGIASRAANVTGRNAVEERYEAKRGTLAPQHRLGCQARICGDLVVDVPPESQVHRQVVRKDVQEREIVIDPVVRLHYVEVAEPDMEKPASDMRRLADALRAEWGIEHARAGLPILRGLQKTLRNGKWKVTAAVRHGAEIVALWPGFKDSAIGAAVDIGSTTIAVHLVDLASGRVLASAGVMNPQIRFGEDLMSRVSYAMMKPGGAAEMTEAVQAAVRDLLSAVAAQAEAVPEDIVEVVVVGNPIMHHLFFGLDPTELGGAPFALTVDEAYETRAEALGLSIAPGAFVYALPCIAGHVGADAAGVVLSERPDASDQMTLLVDVGTNAEIVLGNRERLFACSSPTGPAFEGAQISSGQRAAPGAIERVRIDPETLEPRFKVIGCNLWSDDPGFAAATARFGVTGICGSGIIEAIGEMYLAGLLSEDGVIDGALGARTPRIVADGRTFSYLLHEGEPRLLVTQADIRAIQLAKAALHAGVKLLMDRAGVSAVERIKLAGAFGSHIDPTYAMILGLIPDCALENVSAVGNAAGTGARIALLNGQSRREIEALVGRIEKIETATEPAFQAHFVEAMAIPHRRDPYPRLQERVVLPPRRSGTELDQPARRRMRRRTGPRPADEAITPDIEEANDARSAI